MARKYIEDRKKDVESEDLKKATWVHLRADMQKMIEAFGNTNVKEVNFSQIRDFFRDLESASKTKLNIRTNLHAFYRWLVSCKIITSSQVPEIPTFKVKMGYRKTVTKPDQQSILEEIKRAAVACGNPRIYLAIKILATHVNLRPGDIFQVFEEDVDLKEGVIVINDHKTIEHTQMPKYAPVTQQDLELMRSLPRGFGKMHYFRFDKSMKGYPANSPFGKKLLRKWWKRACEKLEIEGVGLYGGTRHSTARHLRKSKTVDEVKRLVGDRTNEAFNRYLEVDFAELREGAEAAEIIKKPANHREKNRVEKLRH
ncbi:MAG: tyrosine-type recombinase/integrase [Syntrophobacteraceae bacterium]